jgi:hypothetical protein
MLICFIFLICTIGTYNKVQGTRYKVQGTRYKVQGTRYKVQGTRYKVQGTEFTFSPSLIDTLKPENIIKKHYLNTF